MKLSIWHIILVLYPLIFATSIPWNFVFHEYKYDIADIRLISFLDRIFVRHGYIWFSIAYFSQIIECTTSEVRIMYSLLVSFARKYGLFTCFSLFISVWFFGPLIYERVNVFTGGYCDTGTAEASKFLQYQCSKLPGAIWVDGFDASGHVYILLSMCLILWKGVLATLNLHHFSSLYKGYNHMLGSMIDTDLEHNNDAGNLVDMPCFEIYLRYADILRVTIITVSVALIVIWSFMFVITCVFFHTLSEKTVLLVIGLTTSLIITSIEL